MSNERQGFWLDYLVDVCRKLAEKDLGARVGNTQSVSHVFNKFVKEVEQRKKPFEHQWEVREFFRKWIEESLPIDSSDEKILARMYSWGYLKAHPNKTPVTETEKNYCKWWWSWVSAFMETLFNEYGFGFITLVGH